MTALGSFRAVGVRRSLLGEGLCYDPSRNTLYWLDIKGERFFRMKLPDGKAEEIVLPGGLSSLCPTRTGRLAATRRDGFGFIEFDGIEARFIAVADPEEKLPENRFNDGAADPFGGYWAGTMKDDEDDSTGSWYRLDASGRTGRLLTGFHVTNGPAFQADGAVGYLTDSALGKVHRFRPTSDGLEEYEEFLTIDTQRQGYPDGMIVDREDCVWIAFWDGAAVRRFTPDGKLIAEFNVPARRPTNVDIIGRTLFVTTAAIGLNGDELVEDGKLLFAELDRPLGPTTRFTFDDRELAARGL
ncbi:SMP-30/gluconolactonase/LRE family protein [Parvularcula maris]|uniref:SMP-30/gluconolactonase/LRE family protein n=1 Tax=Parvularcula maris TaxID=2965077 RepID=A0A9X2RJW1_9PROT|nr:SMP-30/gluconolactonase/LRE family protein [Parvularcula maris]MCQ8185148.1 SMP-30/gluconolactonase/LRE family protein [Parvularcula maris]